MHPKDILMYGHRTVHQTVQAFPITEVYRAGACGYWSVKDLVAHLASFEWVLVDVLYNLLEGAPTPYVELFTNRSYDFNDEQVNLRAGLTMEETMNEYQQTYARVREAVERLKPETWSQTGLLPWYGEAYDLGDFIVYSYYGHKREHCGQIAVFSDQFK